MKATTRIHVTLDVPVPDVWSGDTTFEQARQQAVEAGLQQLGKILSHADIHVRVVGAPTVAFVIVEDA